MANLTEVNPSLTWQDRVARKKQADADKIPQEWRLPEALISSLPQPLEEHPVNLLSLAIPQKSGVLTEAELKIINDYSTPDLLAALAAGRLTAVAVATAFCKQAAIAKQLTNSVTETYFDQTLARAQHLDALRADGKLAGPLHGLPISVKDGFQIIGSEASIGFVSYLDRIAESNSPLVDMLLQLGAVIHVKTNIPQTLMTADSHNNIFGRTLNPHKTSLGAGGSSGGEGSLAAFRGTSLGVGTDIAGSIRIPALCNGVYGFKPTNSRVPYGGQASPRPPGANFFLPCAGPIANDVDSLALFMKTVIDADPSRFDSTAIFAPWRHLQPLSRPLRIGVLSEDPSFPLQPPIRRILNEAVQKLKAAGHTPVPLSPAEGLVAEIANIAVLFFSLVSGPGPIEEAGEPKMPSVLKVTEAIKTMVTDWHQEMGDASQISKIMALNNKRHAVSEHWRQLWNTYNLDAVIAPGAQHTAVRHDEYVIAPYTTFLNTIDVSRRKQLLSHSN